MQARIAIAIVLLLASRFFSCSAAEGARVGMVGVGADTQNAADLLTASLSKRPGVVLVERAELDRVSREKALTVEQSVKSGTLLGADALLFLEVNGLRTNRIATVRLVGVKQGVVLYSTKLGWPPKDLEEWAEKIAEKLTPVIAKAATPAEKAVKISVLNLRSAINSTSQQLLERELTALLLARLAQEPEVFVLERRQLRAAVFEKELEASEEKFWTGSSLLDGTINRDGFDPKRVTISARLRAPDGTEKAIEVAGASGANGRIIDELAGKILAELKVEKRVMWDPAREAAQHLEEAKWALRWGMWKEAQAAADSAWGLGEQSIETAALRILANARDQRAIESSWIGEFGIWRPSIPPAPAAVDPMERAIELATESMSQFANAATNRAWLGATQEAIRATGEMLLRFFWQAEARAPVQEKLAELRASTRALVDRLFKERHLHEKFWVEDYSTKRVDDLSRDFERGTNVFALYAHYASVVCEKPEETASAYRFLMTAPCFPFARELLREDFHPALGGWKWVDRAREAEVWKSFLQELKSSTNVLMRLEGTIFSCPRDRNVVNPVEMDELRQFITKNKEELLEADHPLRLPFGFDGEHRRKMDSRAQSHALTALKKRLKERPISEEDLSLLETGYIPKREAADIIELLKQYRSELSDSTTRVNSALGINRLYMIQRRIEMRAGLPLEPPPGIRGGGSNRVVEIPVVTNRAQRAEMQRRMNARMGIVEAPPVETFCSPKTITVSNFWSLPLGEYEIANAEGEQAICFVLPRDGKLWIGFYHDHDFQSVSSFWKVNLLRVDPARWRIEETISLNGPEFTGAQSQSIVWNGALRHFEALDNSLFGLGQSGLWKKPNGGKQWKRLPLPAPGGELRRVGTKLYVRTADSLFEFDPATEQSRTLASTRRRPAQSPLDELATLAPLEVTEGPDGTMRAAGTGGVYRWNSESWTRETLDTNVSWNVFGNTIFGTVAGSYAPAIDFYALPASAKDASFVVKTPVPREHRGTAGVPIQNPGGPFNFAAIGGGRAFLYGTNTAFFCDRGKTNSLADFYVFGRAGNKPVQVTLDFDRSKAPDPAREARSVGPFVLEMEKEVLIWRVTGSGIWRIAKSEIEEAIQAALGTKAVTTMEVSK